MWQILLSVNIWILLICLLPCSLKTRDSQTQERDEGWALHALRRGSPRETSLLGTQGHMDGLRYMSTVAFITSRETGISVPESHLNILPPLQTCLFLIEGKLPHNIALTSAVHQRESAIGIHVPPPSRNPHPSRLLQSPGLRPLSHTVNPHWLAVLHMAVYMLPC